MFSIAAINDTESKGQWEHLAPTKEAQEFHLSQTYHEGLIKLQAKEYAKARELLETVLKDPLISSAEVDTTASDGHLLQLRFLALKNLATVFLQQGSMHYENALHCYLQAVEIDTKDSVIWNQLGTLSCSMGLLSISRWAFEQGLFCSPNNWNCMEKLLEILIAIGDEVSCLSIAELILRHWPSHSRALFVKNTIQESEPDPFSPRGIDKLEPKHVRLKFTNKRKRVDAYSDEFVPSKRFADNVELKLVEVSWAALAGAIVGFLLSWRDSELEGGLSLEGGGAGAPRASEDSNHKEKLNKCGNIRVSIKLPSSVEVHVGSAGGKNSNTIPAGADMCTSACGREKTSIIKEKETCTDEEHPQERRSTRLERLRNRKPGKEELNLSKSRDLANVAIQFLELFVIGKSETKIVDHAARGVPCSDVLTDDEHYEVTKFAIDTSKNYGAYDLGHLVLEEVACRGLPHQEAYVKFLELEKLTRQWGRDRTTDCCLFLAELYYDFGLRSSDHKVQSELLSEASYHLCKVIEMVALDTPVCWSGLHNLKEGSRMATYMDDLGARRPESSCENDINLSNNNSQYTGTIAANDSVSSELLRENPILTSKSSFWVRFFWLSGCLSIWADEKAKAYGEFCTSLVLLRHHKTKSGGSSCISRSHCKLTRELSTDRVLHEIYLLKVDFLLRSTVGELIEKKMFLECMHLLSPLLLSTEEVYLDLLPSECKEVQGTTSIELSALDKLIMVCEKAKPLDIEVHLRCHQRKLQILSVAAGIAEEKALSKQFSGFATETNESITTDWGHMVSEEVKALSHCASQIKNFIDQHGNPDISVVSSSIPDIQALLLTVMRNIVSKFICKKSSGLGTVDQSEELESCCFLDASIAFCRLQHLHQSVPMKSQVELIVALHELLAEFGICCAGKDSEGEEGTFLKFAIKHLLSLDTKIKSSMHSLNNGLEASQCGELHVNTSVRESNSCIPMVLETCPVVKGDALDAEKDTQREMVSEGILPPECTIKDSSAEQGEHGSVGKLHSINEEQLNNQTIDDEDDPIEIEIEKKKVELGIDTALDQCFFCLYGLDLRSSDSSSEDDLAIHKNTNRGDYQTKEQCADVFQYILPYIKASSRSGLVKVRRVLRAIRKHFPQPPEEVLRENPIDYFLDSSDLCEDKLSEEAGSAGFLESIMNVKFSNGRSLRECNTSALGSSVPYSEIYSNLYYYLAQAEEMNATDKWPGFVLTKEGEDFVEHNANLIKYDLLYNPLRFESWQRLGNIYDEEVDLLLNDGSKHVNVVGWRKNLSLSQRVETSRRCSRRCLLMSLALAKTAVQQSEMHELLALVYYDGLQNVVPIYDQRSVIPTKDDSWMRFCQNSMKHFEKAFAHKSDWSHAFYLGKLCEKLGYPREKAFSYYKKAISLNPSAVDPVYRMHASRLKLLCSCGKQNVEALKVVAAYPFDQLTNATVMRIIEPTDLISELPMDVKDISSQVHTMEKEHMESQHLEEAWNILYNDCLSALKVCVEGDLKHFHKARYMLAQGRYEKGGNESMEKAKDELSFCFKSSRSSFTINMWEIDGMVKKGRRKTPSVAGNRKALEVNLPESSRKFITCIRKYILFYLKLLQETGDVFTLDRAYVSLRADKRFSLCLEDLVPVALGRFVQALMSSIHRAETLGSACTTNSPEHLMDKIFNLFMDQGNLWNDISNLPEIKCSELSESSFYGYLHQYIQLLEKDLRLDMLEGINEKIRKRFKNPKLSNSSCAKVCRHASVAWYRSIVISLALITPLHSKDPSITRVSNPAGDGLEYRLLCIDLLGSELWSSSFEDSNHLEDLEAKWVYLLSKIKGIIVKQASEENMETANNLLRCSYNFYRESSFGTLPSGINLCTVPSTSTIETPIQPGMDGTEIIDLSIPRKLLLWAYALVFGRYANILSVVKHCEDNAKSKMKKGAGQSSSSLGHTSASTASHTGVGKERGSRNESGEAEVKQSLTVVLALPEGDGKRVSADLLLDSTETQSAITAPQLVQSNNLTTERGTSDMHEGRDGGHG